MGDVVHLFERRERIILIVVNNLRRRALQLKRAYNLTDAEMKEVIRRVVGSDG